MPEPMAESDPVLPPGIETLTLRESLVRLMEWHNTTVDVGNEAVPPYIWCVCGWRSDDREGHPGTLAYAHQADAVLALLDSRAPIIRPGSNQGGA